MLKYLIYVIAGIALGWCIFMVWYPVKKVYHGPDSNVIRKKVYDDGTERFRLGPVKISN